MNASLRTRTLIAAALLGVAVASPLSAQLASEVPTDLRGVGVDQRLGEEVPADAVFTDHRGERVLLGDYFGNEKPLLLTLNYSDCPMLCVMQLDGVVDALNELNWVVGEDFDLVTVSIDTNEPHTKAAATRDHYLSRYSHVEQMPDPDGGWHFLVGDQASIDAVAGAVGFGYRFVPSTGEFAHDASIVLLTPSGVVSRYLFGIAYDKATLRLSLVEASDGLLGGIAEQFTMSCYVYDPTSGTYVVEAAAVMRLAGLVTVVVLGGFLLLFWRKELIAALRTPRNAPRAKNTLEGVS